MALTDLQRPSPQEFRNKIMQIASEIHVKKFQWKGVADILERMDSADLPLLGLGDPPDTTMVNQLTEFRTLLTGLVAYIEANDNITEYLRRFII